MSILTTFIQTSFWLLLAASPAFSQYTLLQNYEPSNFFDGFDFYSGSDPTHGYVNYLDQATATNTGLAKTLSNSIYMGVDNVTSLTGSSAPGRNSVRISSKQSYTEGLFIADIAHMPGDICGVWPAFWTFGPNWPSQGEIDIIEGVNKQVGNRITLHTAWSTPSAPACQLSPAVTQTGTQTGGLDCEGNNGCGVNDPNPQSYGDGFNAIDGGVYAMEWTSSSISVWFFPRTSIPGDISSGFPTPSSWGTPVANFQLSCNIPANFVAHNIVFDTTFCGDWAGQQDVWASSGCPAASCQAFVQDSAPGTFSNAYWEVNSLKVYQQ